MCYGRQHEYNSKWNRKALWKSQTWRKTRKEYDEYYRYRVFIYFDWYFIFYSLCNFNAINVDIRNILSVSKTIPIFNSIKSNHPHELGDGTNTQIIHILCVILHFVFSSVFSLLFFFCLCIWFKYRIENEMNVFRIEISVMSAHIYDYKTNPYK